MGMRMPETCWAVFKRQAINLRNCCIWLVDSFECLNNFCTSLNLETKKSTQFPAFVLNGSHSIIMSVLGNTLRQGPLSPSSDVNWQWHVWALAKSCPGVWIAMDRYTKDLRCLCLQLCSKQNCFFWYTWWVFDIILSVCSMDTGRLFIQTNNACLHSKLHDFDV